MLNGRQYFRCIPCINSNLPSLTFAQLAHKHPCTWHYLPIPESALFFPTVLFSCCLCERLLDVIPAAIPHQYPSQPRQLTSSRLPGSRDTGQLDIPPAPDLQTYSDRSFSVAAPGLRSSLRAPICKGPSLETQLLRDV